MGSIEIPEPVIVADIDWHESSTRTYPATIVAFVEVAGVEVLRRTYTDEQETYGRESYADDIDEAKEKVLAEFGRQLKRLIGDTGA